MPESETFAWTTGGSVVSALALYAVGARVGRERVGVFVGITFVGSLAWNTLLIAAGYLLAGRWTLVAAYVGAYSQAVLVGVAVLLTVVAARRAVTGRRRPIPAEQT